MASPNHEANNKVEIFTGMYKGIKAFPEKVSQKLVEIAMDAKKLGEDDPRRIVHSLKVGLALTLVSLFFYFEPLYDGFGVSAIWAVLTVIVVFEYSVGATLGKGMNRMWATLIAASLGVKAHWIATHAGETVEPFLIATFVFIIAAIFTFIRFFPKMKARYDYGLMVFILTFSLISVSGYRDDEVLEMAYKRVTTIIIGSFASLIVCILIFPVWIGEDLHNLIASNLQKIGNFLEGFGGEYFRVSEVGQVSSTVADISFLQGYKSILTSKHNEENMANLARWEPCHGGFKFSHPWKQYLRVGSLTRHCAYKIEALHGYLNSHTQTPMEFRSKIQETCTKITAETGKTLKELASSVKSMKRRPSPDLHIAAAKEAAENLKTMLKTPPSSWGTDAGGASLLEILPAAAVASLLIDVVDCTEKIAESVRQLASLASFKYEKVNVSVLHHGAVRPDSEDESNHVIINVDEPHNHG